MQGPGSLIEEVCRCFLREGGGTGVRVSVTLGVGPR